MLIHLELGAFYHQFWVMSKVIINDSLVFLQNILRKEQCKLYLSLLQTNTSVEAEEWDYQMWGKKKKVSSSLSLIMASEWAKESKIYMIWWYWRKKRLPWQSVSQQMIIALNFNFEIRPKCGNSCENICSSLKLWHRGHCEIFIKLLFSF